MIRTHLPKKPTVSLALAAAMLFPTATYVCQKQAPRQMSTAPATQPKDTYQRAREAMVQQQIVARGVRDQQVLDAMRKVPRHLFVPLSMQPYAYSDSPLPIGYEQTISQPYIVAFMTEALGLKAGGRVLEVGTGSGYQAAVLSLLVHEVYSIEIVEPLATEAAERLKRLGYGNVSSGRRWISRLARRSPFRRDYCDRRPGPHPPATAGSTGAGRAAGCSGWEVFPDADKDSPHRQGIQDGKTSPCAICTHDRRGRGMKAVRATPT